MDKLIITPTVSLHEILDAGYPNPEQFPQRWMDAIRSTVAQHVQDDALDLDEASEIVEAAELRCRHVTPWLYRPVEWMPDPVRP